MGIEEVKRALADKYRDEVYDSDTHSGEIIGEIHQAHLNGFDAAIKALSGIGIEEAMKCTIQRSYDYYADHICDFDGREPGYDVPVEFIELAPVSAKLASLEAEIERLKLALDNSNTSLKCACEEVKFHETEKKKAFELIEKAEGLLSGFMNEPIKNPFKEQEFARKRKALKGEGES